VDETMNRKTLGALCCIALAVPSAWARGGDVDATFGTAGRAEAPDRPVAVAVQGDGKVVVVTGVIQPVLMRFLANGERDAAFEGGRILLADSSSFTVQETAIAPDGGILVAGALSDGCNRMAIARFNAAGRLDSAFGNAGAWRSACRPYPLINIRVAALADGRIAAFGDSYWFQSSEHAESIVARVDATGRLDASYGEGGYARTPYDTLYDGPELAFAADGAIDFVRYAPDPAIANYRVWSSRLKADGTIDRSPSGAAESPLPMPGVARDHFSVSMLADGTRLLIISGAARINVAAFGRDHLSLRGFGEEGRMSFEVPARFPHPHATLAFRTADGGVLLIVDSLFATDAHELVKVDAGGALDPAFGNGGRVSFSGTPGREFPVDVAMRPDGHAIVAGGLFHDSGSHTGWIARLQVSGDVIEFHNSILDHYFLALDGPEARGIDAGAAGSGWQHTGQSWRPGGPVPVCRFYGAGPNSHFFTSEPGECDEVKRSPGWAYEGLGFYVARVGADGACAAPLRPVHRIYNNRARQGDSNHRYVVDASLVPAMTSRGWAYEAVVFCANP
jgi:uncharacterized delta-60 repeat protein